MKKAKSMAQVMVEQAQLTQDLVNQVISLEERVDRLETVLAHFVVERFGGAGKKGRVKK